MLRFFAPSGAQGMLVSPPLVQTSNLSRALNLHTSDSDIQAALRSLSTLFLSFISFIFLRAYCVGQTEHKILHFVR